jgi:hypothetical protein
VELLVLLVPRVQCSTLDFVATRIEDAIEAYRNKEQPD